MQSVWQEFVEYAQTHSLTRVRMSMVPSHLQSAVNEYRAALTSQLDDPENQSWDSLGPNEHHNAMVAVHAKQSPNASKERGNCPRCLGLGFIRAYSHVKGGKCLQCNGTGSLK